MILARQGLIVNSLMILARQGLIVNSLMILARQGLIVHLCTVDSAAQNHFGPEMFHSVK